MYILIQLEQTLQNTSKVSPRQKKIIVLLNSLGFIYMFTKFIKSVAIKKIERICQLDCSLEIFMLPSGSVEG